MYLAPLLGPIFVLVTTSLVVCGWLARTVKREEKQQRANRRIHAGLPAESVPQKRTLGSQVKGAAWGLLSGIVWVALAIALTLLVAMASQWQQYWNLFHSGAP